MIARRSMADVLREAVGRGWLPAGVDDTARAALVAADHDDMPWYLRVLTGGAAWVGAMFLLATGLGIISVILGERVDLAAVALGLALMPAGIALRARGRSEFQRQSSLVAVIAGQMLLVGGVGSLLRSTDIGAIALIISSVPLVLRYDDAVYRYCATVAIIAAALFLMLEVKVPRAMGITTALTAVGPLLAWRAFPGVERHHRLLDPIAWAAATMCCALLTFQTIVEVVTGTVGFSPAYVNSLMPSPWLLTACLAAALVWLALQVAQDHGASPTAPVPLVAIAVVVVVAVLTHRTPAVLGALLLIVLGFDRRRTGLVAMGAAFLIGFLGLYYYSLSLTLLQKSAVLVASGVACLACAAFMRSQTKEQGA